MLTRSCHWTSSWGSWIQRMSSSLILSLLVPQSSKSFLLLRVLLHMNDTIFTASCGHAWLMLAVSELLWSVSLLRWLSPAVDVLWKCDWRWQWLSPFSWVMTCNNAARFWYHHVSGRLSYNITQVYAHVHARAHTRTRTLTCTRAHTRARARSCARAHTHTHTHTLWMWVLVVRGFSGYCPWQFDCS